MTKELYSERITDANWKEWGRIASAAQPNDPALEMIDGYSALELLKKSPPTWVKDWMFTAPMDIFAGSPYFMVVWWIYLEWRKALSKGNKKYLPCTAERGARQELNRLLVMCGGQKGVPPSKEVRKLACEYVITGMTQMWAGLPREHWMNGVKIVRIKENGAGKKSDAWTAILRSINETGRAPHGSGLTDDQVLDIAIALSTGDNITISQIHTSVTGTKVGANG